MKNLARKFSQSTEPAWSEKGAIVQVQDNASVTLQTPGRRGLPIDAARLKGIVGSAIDTASVGAGWLASSLPVPGENLFRADKASLFRRKEQYDELDESSILNAGNVSSHVETGSPPAASASFLGLGRQSNASTPASGGLGSLIGVRNLPLTGSKQKPSRSSVDGVTAVSGDASGPGPLGMGARALPVTSPSPSHTPGGASSAPPLRDTRPLPLSFEGSPMQPSSSAQDLLDLSVDLTATGPIGMFTLSTGDPFMTTSSLDGPRPSSVLDPVPVTGPSTSRFNFSQNANGKRQQSAFVQSHEATMPARPNNVTDSVLSDDSAMEILSSVNEVLPHTSPQGPGTVAPDEQRPERNAFIENPFSLAPFGDIDRHRTKFSVKATSMGRPHPALVPSMESRHPYERAHSLPVQEPPDLNGVGEPEQEGRDLRGVSLQGTHEGAPLAEPGASKSITEQGPWSAATPGGRGRRKGMGPPKPSRPPPAPPSGPADSASESLRLRTDSMRSASSSQSGLSASLAGTGGTWSDPPTVPELSPKAYDIFEPRADPENADVPVHGNKEVHHFAPLGASRSASTLNASTRELRRLKGLSGRQVLAEIAEGSILRKKWVTHMAPAQVVSASKPTRHIRCTLNNGKVCLHYFHQGVKGLVDKVEVNAIVQRVEVPAGNWSRGKTMLVHTNKGVLALEPPTAAAFSLWVLGLNAALAISQARRKDLVFACPAHAIPRNAMLVVNEPNSRSLTE
eukprot:jgi/Botrbrau1/16603/Bobra.0068s0031.1